MLKANVVVCKNNNSIYHWLKQFIWSTFSHISNMLEDFRFFFFTKIKEKQLSKYMNAQGGTMLLVITYVEDKRLLLDVSEFNVAFISP